jgi:catechol 2,3-dioxygenase-like lactoylglutathione lyase family enzyme
MKIKSVSGITCYVKNLGKTARFYESLGFEVRKRESTHITAYMNWFWMDFVAVDKESRPEFKKEAAAAQKGTAAFIYCSVEDVDAYYNELRAKGLKPSSEPRDEPNGNREFGLRDPDGYRLVFFKRK